MEHICENCRYAVGWINNEPIMMCDYYRGTVDGRTCYHWKAKDEEVDDDEEKKTYDPVNSPKHYTSGKVECIDAMIEKFGVEAVKHFCLCNAFKHHWRGDQDIKKAMWYMDKYKELENRQIERVKERKTIWILVKLEKTLIRLERCVDGLRQNCQEGLDIRSSL